MAKNLTKLVVICTALTGGSVAQCVREPIESSRIEGYLLAGGYGGSGEKYTQLTPEDKGRIELLEMQHRKKIAAAYVDADGKFLLKGIKPGQYLIAASANHWKPVEVAIKLQPASNSLARSRNTILAVVGLAFVEEGGNFNECGGSSITIRNAEDVRQILAHIGSSPKQYAPVLPKDSGDISGANPK